MTAKEFEENYVFEKYKDTTLKGSGYFRKEVEKYKNINVSDVYAKIINYQIKTYGETLSENRDVFQDKKRVNHNAYVRNKARRKTRGTYQNKKEKRWRTYE